MVRTKRERGDRPAANYGRSGAGGRHILLLKGWRLGGSHRGRRFTEQMLRPWGGQTLALFLLKDLLVEHSPSLSQLRGKSGLPGNSEAFTTLTGTKKYNEMK